MRILAAIVCAVAVTNCSKPDGLDQPTASPLSALRADPSAVAFRIAGDSTSLTASEPGQSSSCFGFQSPNSALASVATPKPNAGSASAADTVVTALSYGAGVIHITCGISSLDVPITSWPNGRWSGDVEWQGGCQGSDAKYQEVLIFEIDATGKGTITVSDLPSFPRQYAVTIPSAPAPLTFESSGTFVYTPTSGSQVMVPSHITVTLAGTKVDYGETTAWGSCSNIYVGDLNAA